MNTRSDILYFMVNGGIIEKSSVVIFYKPHATGTGCHNWVCSIKITNKLLTNGFGLFPITGVKGGLSATSLASVVGYRAARLFQHFHHIERRIRKQLIDKTGYEELYVQKKGLSVFGAVHT